MPANRTNRPKHPFTIVSRDGNLLVIQTEKWSQPAATPVLRGLKNARSALAIFILVKPGIGPEKWTIGWMRGDVASGEKNIARIRTAKKNGLIPLPLLPNEESWIPFIVSSVNVTMLRELALARAASIAREATRIEQRASRRCKITPRGWDIDSTREKLREAEVEIQRLV